MSKNINIIARPWPDYELLDSGDNRKLERYGKFVLARPETQAIWRPSKPGLWKEADAEYIRIEGKGSWKIKKDIPETWDMAWNDVKFSARLTSFLHTGVFPEQAGNWEWLSNRTKTGFGQSPRVLNLFGYTGIASIVAAKNGAQVTHVDASHQTNVWAKENAKLSGLPETAIRFLDDDALKFAEREVRRSATYNGIILDPPAFGRGTKGEVWKIEENLPRLLEALKKLLSPSPHSFFLLNGYAAGYSPLSFVQAIDGYFKNANVEFGELRLQESKSDRSIPSGIYVRFVLS
jgi:23S rRNA (cytosine1962-C5)-methyltransferase